MGQVIDYLIVALCLFFAIRGMFLGFVSEILSLIAYVMGYIVSIVFAPRLIDWLKTKITVNDLLLQISAYAVLFLLAYIIVKVVEVQIVRITNTSILSGLNRVLGILLGIIQGVVIVIILDFLLRVQPLFDFSDFLNSSTVLVYIRDMFQTIHQFVLGVIT